MVENTVVDDCLVLPHQQQEKDSGGENEAESLQLPILWIIRYYGSSGTWIQN